MAADDREGKVLGNGRRNTLIMVGVILLALAVIIAACMLIFGDYLIPLVVDNAPYSYITVLVVVLALFFFAV